MIIFLALFVSLIILIAAVMSFDFQHVVVEGTLLKFREDFIDNLGMVCRFFTVVIGFTGFAALVFYLIHLSIDFYEWRKWWAS